MRMSRERVGSRRGAWMCCLAAGLLLPTGAGAVDAVTWMADYDKAMKHADPAFVGVDLARFDGAPAGRLAGPARYVVRIGPAGMSERAGAAWIALPPEQLGSRLSGRAEVALAVESQVNAGVVRAVLAGVRAAGVQRIAWLGTPWDGGRVPPAPDPAYAKGLGSTTNAARVWDVCPVARKFVDGLADLPPPNRHKVLVTGLPQILGSCAGLLDPVKALSALSLTTPAGPPVVARVVPLAAGVKLPDSMPWSRAAPRVVRAGGLR